MIYLKKYLFFILLLGLAGFCHAQDDVAIREVIHQLQQGIQTKNTTILSDILLPNAQLTSLIEEKKGIAPKVLLYTKSEFIHDFGQAKKLVIEEKIKNIQISIKGDFASATSDYSFHVNGKQTHCGTNFFHFYKINNQWKIAGMTDTRKIDGCPEKTTINKKQELTNSSINGILPQPKQMKTLFSG